MVRLIGRAFAFILLVVGSAALGADPIKDMAVQSLGRPGPQPIPGWHFHSVDLNTGVGGDYIYAGWQRGADDPVTEIDFEAFTESQGSNPRDGWEWSPVDLNAGAGGRWIYMFWKRGGTAPVYNVTFIVTSQSSPFDIPGYKAIHVDLNKGSGGPYIWAYYSTDPDTAELVGGSQKAVELRSGSKLLYTVEE
jgi:hypothetical protein